VSGEAEGWLEVSAPGFAPLLIADPAEDPVELVLLRGITVSGRVRDAESRAPLPGARVVLWWVEGRPGLRRPGGLVLENPWSPRPLGEAVAGEGGAFRFESVPALGFHETVTEVHGRSGRVIAGLGALRAGHATMVAEVPLLEDGASWEIDLLLWPAGRLRGRVFEPSGRPAAGAEIAAAGSGRPEQGELPLLYQGVPRSFGRTGPDGTYELESVPVPSGHAVQVRVRARLPGSDDHAVVEVPLRAGETAAVPDLVAPAPARAVLRVVDEADRPIWGAYPGYQVTDPLIDEQRTGPDGRLTLRFPRLASPSERQRMFVHAPGFAPSRTPEFLPSVHAPPEVRVVLGPARRIAGRVLQADGTPATGASLVVTDPDVPVEDALTIPQSWGRKPGVPLLLIHGRATVAHDGTFEVRDLSAGPFHVVASLGGARGALLRVPTGSDALVLVLPPAPPPPPTAAVEGSVLDAETGLPLLDFRVGIEDGTRLLGARRVRPGRFRIERAPLGTWTLRAAASGYLPAVRPGVVVERGGALEPLVVALERGTKVHGMIRAAPGLDLAGAVVVFVGDGGPDQAPSARIGGNGAYEASGFLPGRYRPVIWNGPEPPFAAPETPEVLVVPEQAADVEFDVRAVRAGALSVLVHGGPAPGRRDDGVRIEVRDARGRLVREWRGIDGDFAPTFAVPPGAYAIRFQGPGAAEGQKLVTVEEGRSAAVTLRLE
jgi:hypothetical protein